jgi:hypothetical protein
LRPNDAAKERIRDASHRSEDGGRTDQEVAHTVFGRESRGGCRIEGWRAFTPS